MNTLYRVVGIVAVPVLATLGMRGLAYRVALEVFGCR
jgi:hypothetical protein